MHAVVAVHHRRAVLSEMTRRKVTQPHSLLCLLIRYFTRMQTSKHLPSYTNHVHCKSLDQPAFTECQYHSTLCSVELPLVPGISHSIMLQLPRPLILPMQPRPGQSYDTLVCFNGSKPVGWRDVTCAVATMVETLPANRAEPHQGSVCRPHTA